MENKKIELTKEGVESLNAELRNLIDVVRPDVIQQLKDARAQGDLSENADYDAARNRQAEVEARIKEIDDILAKVVVVETVNGKVVNLGSKVTIRESNGDEFTYRIVGSVEADPLKNKISNVCPLGQALIGKQLNSKVLVKVKIPYEVTIVKIDN